VIACRFDRHHHRSSASAINVEGSRDQHVFMCVYVCVYVCVGVRLIYDALNVRVGNVELNMPPLKF